MFLGDFAEDASVNIHFTTHAADGAPVAPSAAFVAADFRVYKNNSASEKTSVNGISVVSPFDAITGRHLVVIDTSEDTGDTGFWVTGADYRVEINSAKTVDGVSQSGVVLTTFSLQNRYMRGTNAANTTAPDNAGITSIKTVADKLATALQNDGASGWQFTTLALANGPTDGGSGDATLAKQTEILTAIADLQTHGDSTWSTATGFAVAGDAMTLTSGERSAVAGAVDVALINAADGADLIGALADAIAADWVAGDASPLAIVAALKADATYTTLTADASAAKTAAQALPSASTIATQVNTTLGSAHGTGSWSTADFSGVPVATRDLILAGDKSPIVMTSGEVAATLSTTASDAIAAQVALALSGIRLSVQTQLTLAGSVDLRVIQGDDYTRGGVRIDLDTQSLPDPNQDLSTFKFIIAAQSSPVIAVRMPIEGAPGAHFVVFDPPSSLTETWPIGRFNLLYRLEWAADEYQTLDASGVLTIDPFDIEPEDVVDL